MFGIGLTGATYEMLITALERYQASLDCLSSHDYSPNKDEVIKILLARDEIAKLLETNEAFDNSILPKLIELDLYLKERAYRITEVDLAEYQTYFPSISQTWFDQIEAARNLHPWNRYGWLLKGIRLLIWTVNLALFSTLATRFLTGSSNFWEVAIIALPGIVSLLEIKKEDPKTKNKSFFWWLGLFRNFPKTNKFRKLAALFVSTLFSTIFSIYGLLLFIFLLVWTKQSSFSEFYTEQGKTAQDNQNLPVAEQKYLKAIALDSDNFDAHFKLGFLYEELQEEDKAEKEYIIAIKGKHLPAYNNLAYWYIRQDEFLEAIALLEKSRGLVKKRENLASFKQSTLEEKREFKALKYSLSKNLGWALLETEQNEEAEIILSAAAKLAEDSQLQPFIRNPGAAHCLYAKLLEKKAKKPSNNEVIKEKWQKCGKLIRSRLGAEKQTDDNEYIVIESINAEEYQWLYEAEQKLRNYN